MRRPYVGFWSWLLIAENGQAFSTRERFTPNSYWKVCTQNYFRSIIESLLRRETAFSSESASRRRDPLKPDLIGVLSALLRGEVQIVGGVLELCSCGAADGQA